MFGVRGHGAILGALGGEHPHRECQGDVGPRLVIAGHSEGESNGPFEACPVPGPSAY